MRTLCIAEFSTIIDWGILSIPDVYRHGFIYRER